MRYQQLLILSFLCMLTPVSGYSTFSPQCTLPEHSVNYVGGPNARGLLQILWTCMATIIACTYTVLYLELPETKGFWTNLWDDLKCAAITILAPEVVMVIAMLDLWDACQERRRFRAAFSDNEKPWTLTHILYANMGGFVYQVQPDLAKTYRFKQGESGHIAQVEGSAPITTITVRAAKIREAIQAGWIDSTPPLDKEEIMDKSKSNAFGKTVTLCQVTYFVVDIVARAAARLVVTQLEIAVCGFAFCSIITFLLSFQKPKGVATPSVLATGDLLETERMRDLVVGDSAPEPPRPGREGVVDDPEWHGRNGVAFSYLCAAISVPLGAIHLAAWDFDFPTPVDRWLWNGAALASTCVLPAGVLFLLALAELSKRNTRVSQGLQRVTERVRWQVFIPVLLVYVVARAIILVEVVRCLFYLPPGAYKTTWTSLLPHIG
ncbi:hypothetical protein K431DRAFT_282272 [Polychaeton citri CBS 116435]|uniref:Uncharacterized protein n=1 Tax=Polychaeton citri CBS 116435 TaxID=1314669 RepID=A0A9P4URK3_9PEZI|nr:hypothetical protein K431DRAFT_282272 [Polychaeton citri CBS 116435]